MSPELTTYAARRDRGSALMLLRCLRVVAFGALCLGWLGTTVDGFALAGMYGDGDANALAEMAAEVACPSTNVVRVASRADEDVTAAPIVADDAESTHRQLLRTSPRPFATWRSRMLTARRARTGRSK